jgi:hypothetical protein
MFTSSAMPHGHEVMAWTEAETTKFLHDLQDHSGRFCTAMTQNSKWRHSNEAANPGIDSSTWLINTAQRRSRKRDVLKGCCAIYLINFFGNSEQKFVKRRPSLFWLSWAPPTPLFLSSLDKETITDHREKKD